MTDSLYFAYGSNLDRIQMKRRCPGSTFVGAACLPGHTLHFEGHSLHWKGAVANVLPESGAEVLGCLFRLEAEDWLKLDTYEGTYRRQPVEVVQRSESIAATTYVRTMDGASGLPSPAYLARIAHAYGALGYKLAPLLDVLASLGGAPDTQHQP